jgi:hypothetical protein
MSRFWQHFITNGKSGERSVNELLESLADTCERFYESSTLPRSLRRRVLLRQLRKLEMHYDEA